MDLLTFFDVAQVGLIVDGRSADGRLGSGGKLFTLQKLVRGSVDSLGASRHGHTVFRVLQGEHRSV